MRRRSSFTRALTTERRKNKMDFLLCTGLAGGWESSTRTVPSHKKAFSNSLLFCVQSISGDFLNFDCTTCKLTDVGFRLFFSFYLSLCVIVSINDVSGNHLLVIFLAFVDLASHYVSTTTCEPRFDASRRIHDSTHNESCYNTRTQGYFVTVWPDYLSKKLSYLLSPWVTPLTSWVQK